MDEVIIGQEAKGQLVFDQPKFDKKDWLESYRIRLIHNGIDAESIVGNVPYGVQIPEFFLGLAETWQGWEGKKEWRALEGEYDIEAIISKTGHVTLQTTFNMHSFTWRVIAEVMLEAGQLELIASQLKHFFKHV